MIKISNDESSTFKFIFELKTLVYHDIEVQAT